MEQRKRVPAFSDRQKSHISQHTFPFGKDAVYTIVAVMYSVQPLSRLLMLASRFDAVILADGLVHHGKIVVDLHLVEHAHR